MREYRIMSEGQLPMSSPYLSKEDHLVIPREEGFMLNTPERNKMRYESSVRDTTYNAVVVDLDGVVFENGKLNEETLDILFDRTLFEKSGNVPLVVASGRSSENIGENFVSRLREKLNQRSMILGRGDCIIVSSNGARAEDVATGEVLFEKKISESDLAVIQALDEIKILTDVSRQQSIQFGEGNGHSRWARIEQDKYSYRIGFDSKGNFSQDFLDIFGENADMLSVAQRLNRRFGKDNLDLEATTSGVMIDIRPKDTSKELAIKIAQKVLESRSGSQVDKSRIVSLSDSTLGNDEPLAQREGGYSNRGPVIPGSNYPIVINEAGDQYERTRTFLNRLKTKAV